MDNKLIFSLAAVSIGTRLRNKEVLRRWKDRPEKVLDLGCGVGIFCRDLINEGILPIGMEYDFIKPSVGYKNLNTPFFTGDIMRLPLKNKSIPVIFARDVLEHLPDDNLAFLELKRCLQPGGQLIITVPGQNWNYFYKLGRIKPEDHGHLRLYKESDLVKQLTNLDFTVIQKGYLQNPLATLLEFLLILIQIATLGKETVKRSQMTQITAEKPVTVFFYKLISHLVWPLIRIAEYVFPQKLGSEILIIARKQ
jgi:SAM-dependent methyltransferase